jgi:beta-galactosidase/beta-glucuronidase
MQRRNFLKTTGALLAGAALVPKTFGSEQPPVSSTGGARLVHSINRNWRFGRNPTEAACARDFNDSAFERVVLPHTNVRLPWHSFDEKTYQFASVYRRRFKLPPEAKGRHVFVDFEGVMTASTVWLNGVTVGEYKGGFTPFSFDLTPYVDFDGDNILAVQVDSSERSDIPPFGHLIDYLTHGGIYREVALRIVPDTFIENIFAKPKDVLSGKPGLEVECFLQHLKSVRDVLTLEVELREMAVERQVVKLRGLDRHQTFPWVGQAMPAACSAATRNPAQELQCNIVRTSHYPQSRHFLDACDEIGLLVLEEIPGWQHIGDEAWQDISVDNVSRMIRRDWNHPSIILWGVRINESRDDHDFYTRTNAMAHALDPTRQTGGIRYFQESEFLEDVFTMNDFGFPLNRPIIPSI